MSGGGGRSFLWPGTGAQGSATRLGASRAAVCDESDGRGPEPDWPSSARPLGTPPKNQPRAAPEAALLVKRRALSGQLRPKFRTPPGDRPSASPRSTTYATLSKKRFRVMIIPPPLVAQACAEIRRRRPCGVPRSPTRQCPRMLRARVLRRRRLPAMGRHSTPSRLGTRRGRQLQGEVAHWGREFARRPNLLQIAEKMRAERARRAPRTIVRKMPAELLPAVQAIGRELRTSRTIA